MHESQWEELALGVGGEDVVPPRPSFRRGHIPEIVAVPSPMKLEGFVDCSTLLRGGIYVLKYKKQIVYIGQSKCFLSRINSHRSNKGQKAPSWVKAMARGVTFDQILVLPVRPEERNALEAKLIGLYKPKYNTQHKNAADSPKLPLPPLRALVDLVIPPPAPKSEVFVRRAL